MNENLLHDHTDLLSRRAFLTGASIAAATAAAATTVAALPREAHADTAVKDAAQEAIKERVFDGQELAIGHIVHDPDLCAGCRTCELACSLNKTGRVNPELSNIRITTDWLGGYISSANVCKQCPGANCVAACPTGAMYIDEKTGARMVNAEKCVGRRTCEAACPSAPSKIHFNKAAQVVGKCDLCGGDPVCVAHCPAGALSASWMEKEEDKMTFPTDSGITVKVALTGSIIAVAPNDITVSAVNAVKDGAGITVSAHVESAYTQPFTTKVKATYFDAEGNNLQFNDRAAYEMEAGGSIDVQDVYETKDPDAVTTCKLEIMCGKVGG